MSRRPRQSLESSLANEFVFGSETRPEENLSDEISRLKGELNVLKSQSSQASTLLPIDKIVPLRLPDGMKQPRKYFEPAAMARLKDSIAKHGVCEPILTRPSSDGMFEIVSGERRWRSASELGHVEIPGVAKPMSDDEALEIALIAHLLSENISAIEETDSLIGLISLRTKLDSAEVPSLLTKVRNAQSRKTDYSGIISADILSDVELILSEFGISLASFVSNRLPLLGLPEFILEKVRDGKVDPSKAVLVSRIQYDMQPQLINELAEQPLTKSQLRQRIAEIKSIGKDAFPEQTPSLAESSTQPTFDSIQELYTKVSRKIRKKDVPINRKMQVRINRMQIALQEMLAELDS